MVLAILFVSQLITLYLLSRTLIIGLSQALYKFTKSKKVTIWIMALLFLPGTIIHELSHWLMATVLLVRTGKISLFPEFEQEVVKLGSVEIEKSDIFRRSLIGVAPFILGTSIILGSLSFVVQKNLFSDPRILLIVGYLVFMIGNTMFSSKKDLEGTGTVLIVLFAIYMALYLMGVRVKIFVPEDLLEFANKLLLVPLVIDLVLVGIFKIL